MPNNVIQFTIRGVDKSARAFGSVIGSAAKLATGVAALGAAVGAMTLKVAKSEDRVAKFAKRIGVTAESLSRWEFAAGQAGIQAQTFDMAIQRLTRRAAEAAEGMGEAKGALRELGIRADEFAKSNLDQKIATLDEAFSGLTSEADKTRLAFKLFDSEGVAMTQMLGQASEDLQAAARDAERLGAVISEQAAANAEELTNEWGRLTTAIKGGSRAIADELVPLMTGVVHMVTESFADALPTIKNWVSGALRAFFTVVSAAQQAFGRLYSIFNDPAISGEDLFGTFLDNAHRALGSLIDLFVKVAPALGAIMIAALKVAWTAIYEMGKITFEKLFDFLRAEIVIDMDGIRFEWPKDAMARDFKDALPAIGEAVRGEAAIAKEALGDMGTVIMEKMAEAGDAISSSFGINLELALEQAERMMESITIFGEVAKQQQEDLVENARSTMEELRELYLAFQDEQKTVAEEQAQIIFDASQNMIDGVSNSIGGAVALGQDLIGSLKNVAKQVIAQVIASLVKMQIQRMITSKIIGTTVALEGSAEMAKASALSFGNTLASMSAAPFPINLTAPAVAAAHLAATQAGMAAGMASGAALGGSLGVAGVAHGGMDFVPRESTYLLDRGERVLSPNQNRDLTEFMAGGGGTVTIGSIHLFENATNADALLSMSDNDVKELVAQKIYRAMDKLAREGVRPDFVGRRTRA